jgi:DNA (cytosine-5)-methyltransferase 1
MSYLSSERKPTEPHESDFGIVDLFSGAGGLTLGVAKAVNEAGLKSETLFAADVDDGALSVYRRNHRPRAIFCGSVGQLIDFRVRGAGEAARFAFPPEVIEPALGQATGKVDILLAGPPCQGHSSLNNHTRFRDDRNALYLTVPAIAVALGAPRIIVENVPGVLRSHRNVVKTATALFRASGYQVSQGVLAADQLGWPQTRRRFFLVAVRQGVDSHTLDEMRVELRRAPMPLSWAIEDLLDREGSDPLDRVAALSDENAERIAWLFKNDEHDMPNHLRPDCHKNGTTYGAVYGRMWWDRPAPTITTGFLTPGRGRFVHPLRPRTLTPREAARVQGFPDWFEFITSAQPPSKRQLGTWIGNAVPTILGHAAGMAALGTTAREVLAVA